MADLPVVAAVDGSSGGDAAVRYAADRARTLGRPLRIVHVAPTLMPMAGIGLLGVPYLPDEFATVGQVFVDSAVTLTQGLSPDLVVTGQLLSGPVVAGLARVSREAYEVVLGADHAPTVAWLAGGSVVGRISATSTCPIIVVPDHWSASTSGAMRIVVGVKDYNDVGDEYLSAVFTIARHRGAAIEFVYVWDLPGNYAEIVESIMEYSAWQWNVGQQIDHAVARLGGEYDDVRYSLTAVYGRPVDVLRDRSSEADLLVVARRPHRIAHVGHMAHVLFRTNTRPVEVIPLAPQPHDRRDQADASVPHPQPEHGASKVEV